MVKETTTLHAVRTRNFFYQAFIELVHKKGFSSITVKDIVQNAGYNRSTFYLYFEDKFDLLHQLEQKVTNDLLYTSISNYPLERLVNVDQMNERSFDLLQYIYDHREYFLLITVDDTLPHIHVQISNTLTTIMTNYFDFNFRDKSIPPLVQITYMANGTAGLIHNWIERNFDKTPAELTIEFNKILYLFAPRFSIQKCIKDK